MTGLFADIYRGRRVLLTGHTGFKGSWLALWLRELGADVAGVALPPENSPSHWALLDLPMRGRIVDIRDAQALADAVHEIQPEVVFHLAAQALVRRSYADPLGTWSTNVMGTANLLDACRGVDCLGAIVVVTTDKCYENREWVWGYRENERLGGHDPYSASKAGAELVTASFRKSFFSEAGRPLVASARAGNVIGGGDWSVDRLVPDLVRARAEGRSLRIRSPAATRPWQHVLESVSGYLLLGQRLLEGDRSCARAWNFGPDSDGNRTVAEVLEVLCERWPGLAWHADDQPQPHEANLLYLDSTLARKDLRWRAVWNLEAALGATVQWYRDWLELGRVSSRGQLHAYVQAAALQGVEWARQ